MPFLLAIPGALGFLCSRRLLGRTSWPAVFAEAIALSLVLTLIGVNACYRVLGSATYGAWTALDLSVTATLVGQVLLALAIAWKAPPAPPMEPLPRAASWSLGALAAAVAIYTNAQQIANPDDDYWIHAPLQGLMRAGNFPPFNPFFSDIAMNGHYGRNLLIVTFSWLSGADVFLSQHLLTSLLQVVTLGLFFSAFWRSRGHWPSALVGVLFVFFGINAGGRGGLIDTMQNNNAVVHLYLALLVGLLVEVWKTERWPATWAAGLTLGSYAIVYETHFGLVFLSVLGLTPLLAFRGLITRRGAALGLLALALSLPLAFTQGGPLTDLLQRQKDGREHTQAEQLSRGMQNQAQVVKITFPKQELFQILLETGEYQRVAHIYTLDTPLRALHSPSVDRGYAPIWSWDVLKIHFLPLYLFPLSLFVLWRRGDLAGHLLGAFGVIAFLTPALVHFGPIYESEYYRWQFAAALGFAGALGLTVGSLMEACWRSAQQGPPAWRWGSQALEFWPAGLRLLLLGALTLVNSLASLDLVLSRFGQALTSSPSHWLVFPSTERWLRSHPVLDFDDLDYQAARWLAAQARPEERLLTNFRQENNFSILFESTLTGLTGLRCVGHALPLEEEKIGTTPFRQAPAAVAFWSSYRPDPLAQLQVDWLYYRDDQGRELPPLPGAKQVHRVQDGPRLRLIYRLDRSLLPSLQPAAAAAPTSTRKARLEGVPEIVRGGYPLTVTLRVDPPGATPLSGILTFSTVRVADGLVSSETENLTWRCRAETPDAPLSVVLVPPYDEGLYRLQARWQPDPGSPALEIACPDLKVAFGQRLETISIASLSAPPQPWPPRTLLRPEVQLSLPKPWVDGNDTVLGCWGFYSEERGEFDLLPAINMVPVALSQTSPGTLPLITPERSGSYRLALYLSAGQGHLVRIPYGSVEISPQGEPSP